MDSLSSGVCARRMWELKQLILPFEFLLNKLALKLLRHSLLMGQWFVLCFGKILPQYKVDSFNYAIQL